MRSAKPIKIGIKCFYCGKQAQENHHPLIFANRQIDEIHLPLCTNCHRGEFGTIRQDIREACELESIKNNLELLKTKYSKTLWEQRLKYLKSRKETS